MKLSVPNAVRKALFIVGFRQEYRLELFLTALGLAVFAVLLVAVGNTPVTGAVVSASLALVPVMRIQKHRKARHLGERAPPPMVPFATFVATLAATSLNAYVLPAAVINAFFVEDIFKFVDFAVVAKVRREGRLVIEPVKRRELFITMVVPVAAASVAYAVTGILPLLFYPVLIYILLVYSVIAVPREVTPQETTERGIWLALEEMSRRVSFLYFIFLSYYNKPQRLRVAKEAGVIGPSLYKLLRRAGGAFAVATYLSLALIPVFYTLFGWIAFALTATIPFVTFFAPAVMFKFKRSSRASNIKRNLILILSYLASMSSVAEDFTSSMLNLKKSPQLAKLFGLEKEADIYLNIYAAKGNTEEAMSEYADSLPDDFYRDTVRTVKDLWENEGYGAVFRSLVGRLRDFTSRYVDKIAASYETIAMNIISVVVLAETAFPIVMMLSEPQSVPFVMVATGIMSAFAIVIVSYGVLPKFPSEYINFKRGLRLGVGVVSPIAFATLTIATYYMFPRIATLLIALNAAAAMFLGIYVASLEDTRMNSAFLDKFPDLLVLYGSFLSRYNSVERAMMELSQQATFPDRMRRTFSRLASLFRVISGREVTYRGPYWYKYFLFLASLSSKYGSTPKELYTALSGFMVEFKRFLGRVSTFSKSLTFLVLIALFVMTVEANVAVTYINAMSKMAPATGTQLPGGMQPSFQLPNVGDIEAFRDNLSLALLLVALANGIAVSIAVSGSLRDGKWPFLFYVAEVVILYIGAVTNFGLGITTTATP